MKHCLVEPDSSVTAFIEGVEQILEEFNTSLHGCMYNVDLLDVNKCAIDILQEVELVDNRYYFNKFGVWSDKYMRLLYDFICRFSDSL